MTEDKEKTKASRNRVTKNSLFIWQKGKTGFPIHTNYSNIPNIKDLKAKNEIQSS